jgi:hypothetical protein
VNKYVIAVGALDEAITLGGVKPFYDPFFSHYSILLASDACATTHSLKIKLDHDITRAAGFRNKEMRMVSWDWECVTSVRNPLRTRLFAWWYFTIAGGFLLLAINRLLLGQRAGLVLAQLAAAAAFLLFGWMSWK